MQSYLPVIGPSYLFKHTFVGKKRLRDDSQECQLSGYLLSPFHDLIWIMKTKVCC